MALKRGYKKILVLEDDTKFIQPFGNLNRFTEPLKDYDMLYLTGSHVKPCIKVPGMSNIVKVIQTHPTGSYCIGKGRCVFW